MAVTIELDVRPPAPRRPASPPPASSEPLDVDEARRVERALEQHMGVADPSGLVLGALRHRTGALFAPALAHFLFWQILGFT